MNAPDFRAPISGLEVVAIALVKRLGGRWFGDYGLCRCPAHDDRSPSLSMRIGERALLFKCFAGCDNRAVVRALARIDQRALRPCRSGGGGQAALPADPWSSARARDLWDSAISLGGTQAAAYLRRRGLTALPDALRFHPGTPLGRGRAAVFRPALIAAVREREALVAVQRTFLEIGRARRARDLGHPRRMLGRPRGGAVMLAPAGCVLGLAEGIETALSAMALLGIPVWATLGSERLARIALPGSVTRLILLPDNDTAGRRGAVRAVEAYVLPGRTIEVIWPPAGCKDWNDALRNEGEGAGSGWRRAA